jgi:hypothetical protein
VPLADGIAAGHHPVTGAVRPAADAILGHR